VIRRKTHLGIRVLAVLAVASYWAGRSQQDGGQPPIAGLDTRLDYALQGFELKLYDIDGLPSARLTAPVMTSNASSGISVVKFPSFEVIHRENLWNIVAESATVSPDREHIVLSGDVWMRRAGTTGAGPMDIKTSELRLVVSPRTASSDKPVHMLDGNDIMEAVGFRVNMKDNRFQLLNRVKLTYAVN
jgi:LPS export ABC transporter protein LptC